MQRNGDAYTLTFDDTDLPSHYSWKTKSQADRLQSLLVNFGKPTKPHHHSEKEVDQIIADLDASGRWLTTAEGQRLVGQAKLERGSQFISSAAFADNLTVLAEFVAEQKQATPRR